MNKLLNEALGFADGLLAFNSHHDDRIQCFVMPSFPLIRAVEEQRSITSMKVRAQYMHWKDNGAWTGEVSVPMLTDCNLDIVKLVHSECREYSNDTIRLLA